MDDIDNAQEQMERDLDTALRLRRPEGPAAIGECLWCGEPLADGRRWCDADCRDDWEAHRE